MGHQYTTGKKFEGDGKQAITLRRQIKIWVMPLKNTWWILEITGTKSPGKAMVIEAMKTSYSSNNIK